MQDKQKHKVKTKEKILKIALRLFMEKGFREVSISDLIKESGVSKSCFDDYFYSKDQLIYEAVEKFFVSHFNCITEIINEKNESSKEKLFKIFLKYSETESYLKINLSVSKFHFNSIISLMIDGTKSYEAMTKYVINFNDKLLKQIGCIIEEGKALGEISDSINSKVTAKDILETLQSNIVLWAMNKNINIIMLYETSFRYLWKSIKSYGIV